ncbi:MAG: hypothetical protein ABFC24_00310 [Methanoregulaceae archaeon]
MPPVSGTRPGWLIPATIAIVIEILVNTGFITYLLYIIPHECATFAAQSGGRSSCGLEPGAYVVAAVSGLLIVAGIALLIWWHAKKFEVRKKPGY